MSRDAVSLSYSFNFFPQTFVLTLTFHLHALHLALAFLEFNKIYQRLDIRLEEKGESFYQDHMDTLVKDLEKKKLVSGVLSFHNYMLS